MYFRAHKIHRMPNVWRTPIHAIACWDSCDGSRVPGCTQYYNHTDALFDEISFEYSHVNGWEYADKHASSAISSRRDRIPPSFSPNRRLTSFSSIFLHFIYLSSPNVYNSHTLTDDGNETKWVSRAIESICVKNTFYLFILSSFIHFSLSPLSLPLSLRLSPPLSLPF